MTRQSRLVKRLNKNIHSKRFKLSVDEVLCSRQNEKILGKTFRGVATEKLCFRKYTFTNWVTVTDGI